MHGDWTFFVEFKGGDDPPEGGDGDSDPKSKAVRLKQKAAEAVHLYDAFLTGNWEADPPKKCLIVVTSDGFSGIRAEVGDMADDGCYCPPFLRRYASRDVSDGRIFYDRVCWMSSEEFARFANGIFGTGSDDSGIQQTGSDDQTGADGD